MFEVVPFSPDHVRAMHAQDAQRVDAGALDAPFGSWAWTGLVDGRPVACAGVLEVWQGRGYAWAILAHDAGHWMLHIHRAVRRGIALCGVRRIEMACAADFPQAARWAQALGFTLETPQPMRAYLPDGRDAYLYARVQ